LAIRLAGCYIVSTAISLKHFLQLYKAADAKHQQYGPQPKTIDVDHDQWSTYITFQMNLDKLDKETLQFLKYCAFIHHNRIPAMMFEHA
ncbi:hypothetical protein B0H15DRAFT_750658, partial [Mycena belliarum]